MKYQIVYAERAYLMDACQDLEEKVNEKLKEGWKLQGGVLAINNEDKYSYRVMQAMTKEDIH